MTEPPAELSAEDQKLVTLAKATRARTNAAEGAAVRDLDGRTYAAATVALPSLAVSALGVCVSMAVASGSRGLEAAVLLTEWPAGVSRRWTSRSCGTSPGRVSPCTSATPEAASGIPPRPEPRRLGSVDRVTRAQGWAQHEQAVERLRASYASIPPDQRVRLAKRTSNLFRPREANRAPGLDVSGLDGVIAVDAAAGTADVQGMCTYEHLVEATLPHGLIPLVVPQLRTITLGGAVTGLGIESTSFRNGLPHESVTEMDVFTGTGEVVTVRPGDGLFDAFVNSYGSLGYATRLRITARAGARPRRPATRPLRRRGAARQDDGRDLRDAVSTTASGWTAWTAWRSSRGSTT